MEELKVHLEQYRMGKNLLPTYDELVRYANLSEGKLDSLQNKLNQYRLGNAPFPTYADLAVYG